MKIVNRRQLRKKTKSEKNVTDRLTELEKMVRRLRYNAILDIKEIKCCEPKVDYTFEYMYVEFQTIDGSSSRGLTLKMNEDREVEASL